MPSSPLQAQTCCPSSILDHQIRLKSSDLDRPKMYKLRCIPLYISRTSCPILLLLSIVLQNSLAFSLSSSILQQNFHLSLLSLSRFCARRNWTATFISISLLCFLQKLTKRPLPSLLSLLQKRSRNSLLILFQTSSGSNQAKPLLGINPTQPDPKRSQIRSKQIRTYQIRSLRRYPIRSLVKD